MKHTTALTLLFALSTTACDALEDVSEAAFPASPPGVADERAVLIEGAPGELDVLVDGTETFAWKKTAGEAIYQAEGAGPATVIPSSGDGIEGVALTADTIFYTTDAVMTQLFARDRATGTETLVAEGDFGLHRITVVGEYVVIGQDEPLTNDGRVFAIAIADGTLTEMATGLSNVDCLVSDGEAAYYCSGPLETMSVSRVVPPDGAPLELASGQHQVGEIDVEAGSVYWISDQNLNVAPGAVRRTATDGTGGVEELASFDAFGEYIAVNGTHIYYEAEGGVQQLPIAGGTPTRFFNLNNAAGIENNLGLFGLDASDPILAMGNVDALRVISSP